MTLALPISPPGCLATLFGLGGAAQAEEGDSGAKILKMEMDLEAPTEDEDRQRIKREFARMKKEEVHPPCPSSAQPWPFPCITFHRLSHSTLTHLALYIDTSPRGDDAM